MAWATLFRRSRSRRIPSRSGRPISLDASQAAQALVQVARLDQDAVDVVGRRGGLRSSATDAEGEPVLRGRLLRLGLGAGLDDLGDGPGRLGGAEADLLELAERQVVELVLVREQPPDRVDDLGGTDVAIDLEVPGDLRGGVGLGDVGHRDPVRLGRGRLERQPARDEPGEEGVGLLLDRGGGRRRRPRPER